MEYRFNKSTGRVEEGNPLSLPAESRGTIGFWQIVDELTVHIQPLLESVAKATDEDRAEWVSQYEAQINALKVLYRQSGIPDSLQSSDVENGFFQGLIKSHGHLINALKTGDFPGAELANLGLLVNEGIEIRNRLS